MNDVDKWYREALAERDEARAIVLQCRDAIVADRAEVERLRGLLDDSERRRLESDREAVIRIEMETRAAKERDAAVQRAESENVRRVHAEADTVARIVAWLDDVDGRPIGAGTLHDFGLQDYANRVDAFRELFAGALRAGAWRGKGAP